MTRRRQQVNVKGAFTLKKSTRERETFFWIFATTQYERYKESPKNPSQNDIAPSILFSVKCCSYGEIATAIYCNE